MRCSTWTNRTTIFMFSRDSRAGTWDVSLVSRSSGLACEVGVNPEGKLSLTSPLAVGNHKTRMSDSTQREQLLAPLPREIYPAKISWNLENRNSTRNPQVRKLISLVSPKHQKPTRPVLPANSFPQALFTLSQSLLIVALEPNMGGIVFVEQQVRNTKKMKPLDFFLRTAERAVKPCRSSSNIPIR